MGRSSYLGRMVNMDYKERIRKLLALSKSPEENEARAALLKARALMAKHKLSEAELGIDKEQAVQEVVTEATFSTRRCPWINDLSIIIGENYCCQAFRRHTKGKKTYKVGFVGLEDDIEVCVPLFEYALDCILSKNARTKKRMAGYPAEIINSLCDGYGYGFVAGLDEAFAQQKAENEEWGLVLVMPKEVTDATSDFEHKDFCSNISRTLDRNEFNAGLVDGIRFHTVKRLNGNDQESNQDTDHDTAQENNEED